MGFKTKRKKFTNVNEAALRRLAAIMVNQELRDYKKGGTYLKEFARKWVDGGGMVFCWCADVLGKSAEQLRVSMNRTFHKIDKNS